MQEAANHLAQTISHDDFLDLQDNMASDMGVDVSDERIPQQPDQSPHLPCVTNLPVFVTRMEPNIFFFIS